MNGKAKTIISIILLIIVFALSVVSVGYRYFVGNVKFIDTKWNYISAYIDTGDKVLEVEIDKWSEDESTFTIITKDGTVYCTDQKNVVMVGR